jgi:hypothetical protein
MIEVRVKCFPSRRNLSKMNWVKFESESRKNEKEIRGKISEAFLDAIDVFLVRSLLYLRNI